MMKRNKIVINADDVGISPGSINAVKEAIAKGILNSISIMTNGEYFPQVVNEIIKTGHNISCGIHLDLTYGRSLTVSPVIAPKGVFNKGFIGLLVGAYCSASLKSDIEKEFEAQIKKLQDSQVEITHLDSHRHVHMIPPIFKIVRKLAEKNKIAEVRVANEKIFSSLAIGRNLGFLFNGGIIKALLLKIFSWFCCYPDHRPFFSLLYTGKINHKMIERILNQNKPVEVGIHPGIPEMDKEAIFFNQNEAAYWRSPNRQNEFKALA